MSSMCVPYDSLCMRVLEWLTRLACVRFSGTIGRSAYLKVTAMVLQKCCKWFTKIHMVSEKNGYNVT
jgi:hypothetical protein